MTASTAPLNVFIASPLEDAYIAKIAAVDPRVKILYRPDLLGRIRFPSDHDGEPFVRTPAQQAEWDAVLAQAEVMFDFDRKKPEDLARRAPRLRLIYACSAGVTSWIRRAELVNTDIALCNGAGVHSIQMAEWAMLAMLVFAKNLRLLQQQQAEHRWERFTPAELNGATVALIGLGASGAEIARRARAFGMRILVHRRRLDAPLPPGVEVHGMFRRERLTEMLAQADYLVICVPDSPGTDGMIGKTELNTLPRHAVIVNIGRGTVIDEPALIEALRAGRLAGAALDVFHKEPLPADSPLWDMPNVIITPHNVSQSDRENDRQIARFTEVLRAYLAGQPLPYLVDKRAGYGVGAPAVQPR